MNHLNKINLCHALRILFFSLTVGLLTSAVSANTAAIKLVDDTTAAIKTAIKKEKDTLVKDKSRLMELVDNIVFKHFDFTKMSSWAMGKYWKEASANQKKTFETEFHKLLVRTYATALLDNVDRKIEIVTAIPHKRTDKKVMVKTEAEQDGGFPIPIDYKMQLNDGHWMVYDVIIDGISLVSNYRTSFATEIRKSGIDSVIASLKERNSSAVE